MITIYQNDIGYVIGPYSLLNADDSAFDLTTYTVRLKAWRFRAPGVLVVNGAADIASPATGGIVSYTVLSGNFASAEQLCAEWEATKTNVRISFPIEDGILVKESA
jgi:hypothetical protein